MRIEFRGLPAIEVKVGMTRKPERIIAKIVQAPGMAAVIESIAKDSWYERYPSWDDVSERSAGKVAQALFRGGRDGGEEALIELAETNGNEPEADFNQMFEDKRADDAEAIVSAVAEHCGAEEDDVRSLLQEAIQEDCLQRMEDLDESKPSDIVPDHVRVEVVHFFGLEGLGVDDRYLSYASNVFNLGTAEPDERLAAFFEGLNVDFAGFREHVRAEEGVDLAGGPGDEALVQWLTDADYIGDRDRARGRAVERAKAWQAFSPSHDASRQPTLGNDDALTVLTEATQGGVPCFVARVKLKDLLAQDWEAPLRFDPTGGYRGETGGFVGIFDPLNGSGYIERARVPVHIPAGTQDWRVSGLDIRSVDDTFGIVPSFYHADPVALPVPAAEAEPDQEAPAPGM